MLVCSTISFPNGPSTGGCLPAWLKARRLAWRDQRKRLDNLAATSTREDFFNRLQSWFQTLSNRPRRAFFAGLLLICFGEFESDWKARSPSSVAEVLHDQMVELYLKRLGGRDPQRGAKFVLEFNQVHSFSCFALTTIEMNESDYNTLTVSRVALPEQPSS